MLNLPLRNELSPSFIFSQSSLQDYSDCCRRFQLRYIEQLKWPAVENAPVLENEHRQVEGQQFHRMVQQLLIGLPVERLTQIANNSNSENIARWWGNFLSARKSSLIDLTKQQFFPEQSLSAPLGKHRITAKYDLITVIDGQATIYDWKTYHNRPRDEQMAVRLQTKVYLSLLLNAGAHLNNNLPFSPERAEMVYWYADFPSEPFRYPSEESHYKRDWKDLDSLISEISAKRSFPLTDDQKKCGYCTYRSFCERGISATERTEFEDTESESWDVDMEQIQEIEF